MANLFAETDPDRLVRRISAVTAGDLSQTQIKQLVEGDVELMKDLAPSSKQKVIALTTTEGRGQLEKIVGPTTDYVPIAFLEMARSAATSVARIIDSRRRGLGTGVMVSPRLLLTNNHVIPTREAGADCAAQFNYELGTDNQEKTVAEFRFDPSVFFWTSHEDELDCTLIAVTAADVAGDQPLADFGWTAMSSAGDKHAEGDHVTLIEHPEGDFKQIALRDNRVLGRGIKGVTLLYSADTLGGSSGSPVFNDEFALVALHHAGGWRNDDTMEDGTEDGTPAPEECNEGIRISRIVQELRGVHDTLPPGLRELLAETLNPPPTTGARLETVVTAPAGPSRLRGAATATGDLHIPQLRISYGDAAPTPGTLLVAPLAEIASAPVRFGEQAVLERNDAPEPDYPNRRGYDPEFLGQRVAPPTMPAKLLAKCAKPKEVSKRTAANVLLPYHRFSVVVRADRRMPLFTMVNIDGRKLRRINRKTGVVEASETWFADPRIADGDQLDQPLFDGQRPRRIFDRGHMVRRLDPAWGSPSAAKLAADDTFHFTNCCPQLLRFNQHLWQGIENYALDNARDEKKQITVITGPVFTDNDPDYRDIKVPRRFWKVVVRRHDGNLRATGFIADQGEALDAALASLEAFADLADVAVFQKSIAEIEEVSGLGLAALRARDSMVTGLEAASVPLIDLDHASW